VPPSSGYQNKQTGEERQGSSETGAVNEPVVVLLLTSLTLVP
jgi:hypothetical protein